MGDAIRSRKSRDRGLRPFPVIHGASVETLFWLRVDKRGPDECWPWTGSLYKFGYGRLAVKRANGTWHSRVAHIVSFEIHHGPVPEGLTVDHVCHNGDLSCDGGNDCPHRRCVNPAHLEAVTRKVNANRSHCHNGSKTHCPQDHEYTPDNIYWRKDGSRVCRTCVLIRSRARVERRWDQGLTSYGTERREMKSVVLRYLAGKEDDGDGG